VHYREASCTLQGIISLLILSVVTEKKVLYIDFIFDS